MWDLANYLETCILNRIQVTVIWFCNKWLYLNIHTSLSQHADPLVGLFVFREKRADNAIHANLKSIPSCYIVRYTQFKWCHAPQTRFKSHPFLHFTTHATTSHLRNSVGNCVTVTALIHHVRVMSVFMLRVCLHVFVCKREHLGWWSHLISILYMCGHQVRSCL